ncbi:hypothetical protein [Flavisolibacter tropicus]|uniref:Uncharacterized protein n=1 Tax=Flavisolibacter tropicus TaxID=1492898 RepID=A0A172TVE6_9BACT|nr:hypothetical protein [Flavisolibacter tropicus]ANE51010.1 hypothetical protein SY85_11350 [Flavisolibacter tropicus]
MIKRVDITSPQAFAYIQEQLDISGKTLANQLLSKSLLKGKVFTYVPENAPSELLYRFETGGIYPFDRSLLQNTPALVPVQNDARPVVINDILQYLRQNKEHCCLFEEAHGKPTDPWVEPSQMKYVYLNDEMYYFFNKDAEPQEFEDSFRTSEGYYFLCALSSLPIDSQNGFSSFNSLNSEQLKSFASNVVSFFVRAYDGEGYLQWSNEVQVT